MRPIIGITTDIDDKNIKLNRQYADAVEAAGACPVLLIPSDNAPEIITKIDGLLISGGDDLNPAYYKQKINYEIKIVDRKRSSFELLLIHEIIKLKRPVLGICYGMQLINVAFGGSLYQDIGSQVTMAIDHKKDYHIIKVVENRFIERGEYNVNSSHHQAIESLGRDLKAIAFSEDNIIEAVYNDNYPYFLGVQWHPERLNDNLSEKIFRSFVEASGGSR